MKALRSTGLLLAISVFAVLAHPPQIQAQSLADAAKKEKARRAKIASPGKVLTEEDAAAKVGSVTAVEAAQPPSASRMEGEGQPEDALAKPQAVWKGRAEGVRGALVSAQKALDEAQRAESAFRSDVAPLSAADAQDPMRLQKREARLAEMNKQIEVLKAAVAAARANITALEDEARRAGVPAGWLR
jgi:chromosome segregation ATPase